MSKPYAIISDQHFHNWSAFSSVSSNGVNSRLEILLQELRRCAKTLRAAGGNTIINAGDTFHVRGNIAPSVLNPVLEAHRDLISNGFEIVIVAGNHDLESKEATRVGSAITALEEVGCKVVNDYMTGLSVLDHVIVLPWQNNIEKLKEQIEEAAASEGGGKRLDDIDLILHAPIDDVLPGIPPHGLTGDWLAERGFRRVFAGHYHHHKLVYDGSSSTYSTDVYSIGACAHHTWGDVGSKAGFLVVQEDGVKWFASHAPQFVEITSATDYADIPLIADGNYVRVRINSSKQSDVEEMRSYLADECGARGVVILAQKDAAVAPRAGATVKAGASLRVSVGDFIKARGFDHAEKLALRCDGILADAQTAMEA